MKRSYIPLLRKELSFPMKINHEISLGKEAESVLKEMKKKYAS